MTYDHTYGLDIFKLFPEAEASWASSRKVSPKLLELAGASVTRKFKLAFPPHVGEALIWHYTDEAGALGILKSGELWASSIDSLNDRTELDFGLDQLRRSHQRLCRLAEIGTDQVDFSTESMRAAEDSITRTQIYSISASLDGDSLSQWRAYGGSRGCCLGLSTDSLKVVSDDVIFWDMSTPAPRWAEVLYRQSEQEALADRTVAQLLLSAPDRATSSDLSSAVGRILNTALYLKHPTFADEREVRIVFGLLHSSSGISFRPGKFGITPYIRATLPPPTTLTNAAGIVISTSNESTKLPIRAARVAPSPDPGSAVRGLNRALEHYGFSAYVETSSIPYR